MIRASGWVGAVVDRRLPHTLQTYATLYGAWVQGLRAHRRAPRRLAANPASGPLADPRSGPLRRHRDRRIAVGTRGWRVGRRASPGVGPTVARVALIAATLALLFPFVLGAVRMARALAAALAAEALPGPADARTLDLAAAPRRALVVTLQIAILLVRRRSAGGRHAAVPAAVRGAGDPAALAGVAGGGALAQRHEPGGARAGGRAGLPGGTSPRRAARSRAARHAIEGGEPRPELPGLGNAEAIRLEPGSAAVGRTLRELDLRGLTGATVIAIDRRPADVIYPTAEETLRAGDTLVVTGAAAAVAAARELLRQGGAPPPA